MLALFANVFFLMPKLSLFAGRISTLMRKGKYHEAYGIMLALERCGQELRDTLFLIRYYSILVLTDRPSKADLLFTELCGVLRNNQVTRPQNILKVAEKLKKDKLLMESICLYFVAARMFVNTTKTYEIDLTLLQCLQGITQALDAMIDKDVLLRLTIKRNVVPHALAMLRQARDTKRLKNKHTRLMESVAFHCAECCLYYTKEHEARLELVEEAISFMEKSFRHDVVKYQLYGTFLHNLGSTYLMLTQLRPAEAYLCKAIKAFRNAKDHNPVDLKMHIAQSQAKLELITTGKV